MLARRFYPARPVAVWADREGKPYRLTWRGRERTVAAVEHSWQQDYGWWAADAVSREYHRLRTADGLCCVVYRDRPTGRWFLHSIMD